MSEKTYYAHVVKWIKGQPDSPANMMSKKIIDIIYKNNTPEVVPSQFYDEPVYSAYLVPLQELEFFTMVSPGLVTVYQGECSIFLFDSEENLVKYNTEKTELPIWADYVTTRDAFLEQLQLSFEVYGPREIVIADDKFQEAFEEILQNPSGE